MPNKATEACTAIKAAWEAVSEIVGPVSITADKDKIEVHVISLRQLEQIPGSAVVEPQEEYEASKAS
jgi:hypothetical protein